jgi:nitronate monooxygenase
VETDFHTCLEEKMRGVNGASRLLFFRGSQMLAGRASPASRLARGSQMRRLSSTLSPATQRLLDDTGAKIPIIKGPMYPGSNPELVAAVSAAGGFGVVQPIALTHLYGHDFREGLRLIKSLTSKPFGVNFTIVENKRYMKMMNEWMDISIDEGVRFFLTSLGKPNKIVKFAHEHGVKVYHDAHTPQVALKCADAGVDGLNCLNDCMGGQTGNRSAAQFAEELESLLGSSGFADLPRVQAGGVGDSDGLRAALELGYAGAQLGTRFLATHEAKVTNSYKKAICKATSEDIVWTNKLAGTNSSVIMTPQIASGGLRVNPIVGWLLRNNWTKLLTRTLMLQRALNNYKRATFEEDYEIWQAGKGVDAIHEVESCADVLGHFAEVASR